MRKDVRKKRSAFDVWVLALAAVILVLMFGWFLLDLIRPSGVWRVEAEREDSPEVSVSGEKHEKADGLLDGEVMDLNAASAADLERLPNVGAVRAKAVVEYRRIQGRFASVEDLLKVDGFGPGILETLRPYVTVG